MFSCKTRGFCPSCHAKRVEEWGEWMRETLLLDVPHRQVVFTIPKMLRIFFKFKRRLLGDLCRCALRSPAIYGESTSVVSPGPEPISNTLFPRSIPSRAHGTTSFSTVVFHWAERQYHLWKMFIMPRAYHWPRRVSSIGESRVQTGKRSLIEELEVIILCLSPGSGPD